jgi:Tfp pilus assembly protein PilZ
MNKFARVYQLVVEDRNRKSWIFDKFALSFSITKNIHGHASEGNVTLVNLSEETRGILLKDRMDSSRRSCQLYLGYEKQPMNLVLRGNIFYCSSKRQGIDFQTEIAVADGGDYYLNGFLDRSYAANSEKNNITNDLVALAAKKGLGKGQIDSLSGVLARALTINKKASQVQFSGYDIYVENEQLNIVAENNYLQGADVLLISSESGLLDTPLRYDSYVEVKMILEASARLNQKVRLEAEGEKISNGDYKITGISHEGSIAFQGEAGECITTLELQKI